MNRLYAAVRVITSIGIALFCLGCAHVRQPPTPSLDALIAELAQPVANVCARDPALCEKACVDCPDVGACLKANGNCAAAPIYFNDVGDGGLNPFVAGCHMQYSNHMCTVNGQFLDGDSCIGDWLLEWWQATCHRGMGDVMEINCRKLCERMGRPGGTCKDVDDVCPDNQRSARCICDPVVKSIQP
jgi:hypothetical protein